MGDEAQTLTWGEDADAGSVSGALEYCNSLNHGGITPWRLATQKELQTAYAHGIHDLDSEHTDVDANPTSGSGDNLGDLDTWFWSSSTQSDLTSNAWYVYLFIGYTVNTNKTNSLSVLCVSP